MKNLLYLIVPAVGLLVLASCGNFSPEQIARAEESFRALYDSGKLSREEFDAIMAAFRGGGMDWGSVLTTVGEIGAAVLFSLTGVRIWRGSVNDRKGAAPTPTQ